VFFPQEHILERQEKQSNITNEQVFNLPMETREEGKATLLYW
jgi:hypothetical protein